MMAEYPSGTFFMQGNEALAEAAIYAGCKFFAGYPITPASEIAEHLAVRLPQVGGVMIQMEDEIASLASVVGASWAGVKAMTATSGPGFSLMQENLGYAFMTETPCVLVDVQRTGPSTGQATKCAQGDVMQSRWGTHGDYTAIVLSPNSVQEMFDLTVRAFNLAEAYRTPVIVLADEIIAHMREQLYCPASGEVEIINRRRPTPSEDSFFGGRLVPPMPSVGEGHHVTVTGSTHDDFGIRFTSDPVVHRNLVTRISKKIKEDDAIVDFESFNTEDCEVGVVSFGCTSRAVYEAVEKACQTRVSAGYLRLKTIWPFPERAIHQLAQTAETLLVPEMNLRQIFFEVQRVAQGDAEVVPLNKIGGGEMITPEEILHEMTRKIKRQ